MNIVIWLVVAAVVVLAIWAIATSNRFKTPLVKIDEADSGIDVALNGHEHGGESRGKPMHGRDAEANQRSG